MGQAFDRDGNVLGEAYGNTKSEVFEQLNRDFKDAHEIRVRAAENEIRKSDSLATDEQPTTSPQGDGDPTPADEPAA